MAVTTTDIENMLGTPLYDRLLSGWGSGSSTPTQDLIDESIIWVKGVFLGMNNEAAYDDTDNSDTIDLAVIYYTAVLLWERNQNPDKRADELKKVLEYLASILGNKVYNYIDGEEPSTSTLDIQSSLYHYGGVEDE